MLLCAIPVRVCVCVCVCVIIANHVHHCMFIVWLNVFIRFFFCSKELAETLVSVCVIFGRGLFSEHANKKLRHVFARTFCMDRRDIGTFYKEPAFSVMEQIYCSESKGFSHCIEILKGLLLETQQRFLLSTQDWCV